MKTMKDYHDLHLKCNFFFFLADVFKRFTNNSLKNCGLCSSHYLSSPGFIRDGILKMKKIELGLIPDLDMYIFFEKGTTGEISIICNRYNKVNNRYVIS